MFNGITQSIMTASVFIVFYIIDLWMISKFDRKRDSGTGRSWDYTLMILIAMVIIITQPIFLPILSIQTDASYGLMMQLTGIFITVGGIMLNVWARRHLREFYAERVEVQPQHRIVNTGPYAYVRHPIFTSFFLLIFGLLLVNPSLPILAMVVYTFTDFTRAARQEEALLSTELPGYKKYMQVTSRFLPRPSLHVTGDNPT